MIQPSQISVHSKSVSARSPCICFEGVVELCSQLWLVVTVRHPDKQKGSIDRVKMVFQTEEMTPGQVGGGEGASWPVVLVLEGVRQW